MIQLSDLDIDVAPRLTVESVEAPTEREGGVIVETVDDLLDKLRNEAKVIWNLAITFISKRLRSSYLFISISNS